MYSLIVASLSYDSLELILAPAEPISQNPVLYVKPNFGAALMLPLLHPSSSLVSPIFSCCGARMESRGFRCEECFNKDLKPIKPQWPDRVMREPSVFTRPLLNAFDFDPLESVVYESALNEDLVYILEQREAAWRELHELTDPKPNFQESLGGSVKERALLMELNRRYRGERIIFREVSYIDIFPSTKHFRGLRS